MDSKSCKKTEDQVSGFVRKFPVLLRNPRLSVFRSNTEIYAQLIDDDNGVTLAAASIKRQRYSGTESN